MACALQQPLIQRPRAFPLPLSDLKVYVRLQDTGKHMTPGAALTNATLQTCKFDSLQIARAHHLLQLLKTLMLHLFQSNAVLQFGVPFRCL